MKFWDFRLSSFPKFVGDTFWFFCLFQSTSRDDEVPQVIKNAVEKLETLSSIKGSYGKTIKSEAPKSPVYESNVDQSTVIDASQTLKTCSQNVIEDEDFPFDEDDDDFSRIETESRKALQTSAEKNERLAKYSEIFRPIGNVQL